LVAWTVHAQSTSAFFYSLKITRIQNSGNQRIPMPWDGRRCTLSNIDEVGVYTMVHIRTCHIGLGCCVGNNPALSHVVFKTERARER
jgi:hypothetical protein